MDNHVHLIGVPQAGDALARICGGDPRRLRTIRERKAADQRPLLAERYFSCALGGNYCWKALAYVERNPVRAGMVVAAGEWGWCSAWAHLGEADTSHG